MSIENNTTVKSEGGFSPKKFLIILQSFIGFVFRRWYIVLLGAIAGGAFAYFYYADEKPEYTAELTFAVDEQISSGNNSRFDQIASQLGIESAEGNSFFSSIGNISALIFSRNLIERTLRKSILVNGHQLVFADFFLDSTGYRKKWAKNNQKFKIRFDALHASEKDSIIKNQVIQKIHSELTKKLLTIDKKYEQSTIVSVKCVSQNELFSKLFLEALIDEVTSYYVKIQTKRTKTSLANLDRRTDSVYKEYVRSLKKHAAFSDANINLVKETAQVPIILEQTDADVQKASYIQLSANLEKARNALMDQTPIIQILDSPVLPLEVDYIVIRDKVILFALIATIVTIAILLFVKGYKFVMASDE